MSRDMFVRIKNECSKQQIMSESLDYNTPPKTDLRFYMPFIASSFINGNNLKILSKLKI